MPVQTPRGIQGRPLAPAPPRVGEPPPERRSAAPELTSEHGRAVPTAVPRGPVHPQLRQLGFFGTVHEFGDRVARTIDAHTSSVGWEPQPGLVLDVARSSVPTEQISTLFNGHANPPAAGALNRERENQPDWLQVHNGKEMLWNPFMNFIHSAAGQPDVKKELQPQQYQHQFQKYPMLQPGYMGIDNFHGFSGALAQLGDIAKGADKRQSLMTAEAGAGQAGIAQKTMEKFTVDPLVNTVKQGQTELQQKAPQFFQDLPADGNFNDTWAKRVISYQHSSQWARDAIKQKAKENFLSPNEYVRAWHAKETFITKQPFLSQIAAAVPLTFWANGHPEGIASDLYKYMRGSAAHGWWHIPVGGGHHIGVPWIDPVSAGLNSIVNTGKLAFGVVGGATNQAMADATAMNSLLLNTQLKGKSYNEAMAIAKNEARRVPGLIHMVDPLLNEPDWLRGVDQAGTFLALVYLGRFSGVAVKAGDSMGLARNAWFKGGSDMAFHSVRKGEPLGIAAKALEGGSGAERAVVWLKDNPTATITDFRAHLANEWAGAESTVFKSLRSRGLPTPGPLDRTVKKMNAHIGHMSRDFEAGARQSGLKSTNHAVDFARTVAGGLRVAAPRNAIRQIFGPTGERFTESVYNWSQKELGSTAVANQLRDEALVLKAKGDVPGLQDLNERMLQMWRDKHPDAKRATPLGLQEVFNPLVESDLPGTFYFPGGALETRAQRINEKFNKIGAAHRQIIVSGLPLVATSLMWKHTFADTLRRFAAEPGQAMGWSRGARAMRTELAGLSAKDANLRRMLQMTKESATQGEFRWMARMGPTDIKTFSTGEHLAGGKYANSHLNAAGAYLRRHLNDTALDAYLKSSPQNMDPLIGYVMGNDAVRSGILHAKPEYSDAVKALHAEFGTGQLAMDFRTGGQGAATDMLRRQLAADHAELIRKRFQEMDEAFHKAGVTMEQARGVSAQGGEKALAAWIKEHNIDLPVHEGKVTMDTRFDNISQKIVGQLMRPNKWNRGKLYDYLLHHQLADMKAAGMDTSEAAQAAANIAHSQTVYHMLDFSNMLQMEQDLRWASYFATKHRLYWTWVARYMVKNPLTAAALTQFGEQANLDRGNIDFSIAGQRLQFPLMRLLWVNAREYPESSPLLQAAVQTGGSFLQGQGSAGIASAFTNLTATSGNIFTRDDQGLTMLLRLGRMEAGHQYTFESATTAMTPAEKHAFATRMIDYGLTHRKNGVFPNEQDAVKAAMLAGVAEEFQRANLLIPIVPVGGIPGLAQSKKPQHITDLQNQYDKLSAKSKLAFLQDHPELRDWFGISNPDTYWHNQPLYQKLNAAGQASDAQKKALLGNILANGGVVSAADEKQIKKISADFGKALEKIKEEDRATWHGQGPPPFSTRLDAAPLSANAFIHQVFPNIGKSQLDEHTVTQRIESLRRERNVITTHLDAGTLNQIGYDKTHALERLHAIKQITDPLRSYPTGTLDKAQRAYEKIVTRYRNERTARSNALQQPSVASAQKDQLYNTFRAWRDSQDKPIHVTVDGHTFTFPSPVQIGYAMLDGPTRQAAISKFAGEDWQHLASYELRMLGVTVPPKLSEAQTLYQDTLTSWHNDPTVSSVSAKDKIYLAKQVDKYYPGYYQFYLGSQKPKMQRLEVTSVYRNMDAGTRALLDANVFSSARAVIGAIQASRKNDTGAVDYYKKEWRQYVKVQLVPWLKSHPDVNNTVLQLGGMDFLNTLVG